jgi:hypothetical protein
LKICEAKMESFSTGRCETETIALLFSRGNARADPAGTEDGETSVCRLALELAV